eukprot:g15960.t1
MNHQHPEIPQDQHHAHHRLQHHHQQQTRRPATSQALQRVVSADSSHDRDDEGDDTVLQVLQDAAEEQHQAWWAQRPPEMRIKTTVKRFGERYFVDELPCRTRKSVADATAAGKEYVTAKDIIRMLENVSDGEHVLSEEEAQAICEAWGTRHPEGKILTPEEGPPTSEPTIPKEVFLQILEP